MDENSGTVEQASVVAEGGKPEGLAAEVIEETVVEAEPEKSEPAIEAASETPKPAKPVRVCSQRGHESGNSRGKIRFGRIVEEKAEDGSKRYVIAALCDSCVEAEKALPPEEQKPVFKIGFLISQVGELNRRAKAFEEACGYWERVAQGIETPEIRKTAEGKLACGIPGCFRCHDGLAAVEHFVVLKIAGLPVVIGICPAQAAALAKCEADIEFFVTKNFDEAKRRMEVEIDKTKAFEAAKEFWLAVDAGEAVVEVRVKEAASGDIYRCGVPGCKCREVRKDKDGKERGDNPVQYYVVLDGQAEMPIAGICRFQFAALRQSGAKIFSTGDGDEMGLLRCEKRRRWLLSRADDAVRAVQGRPPRPQDFDRIGGGLARFRSPEVAAKIREEKRETREERDRKRAARQFARARASNPEAGNGKKARSKKGGKQAGKK